MVGRTAKMTLICSEMGEGELHALCKPSTHADVEVSEDPDEKKVYWVTITPKEAGKCSLIMQYGGRDVHGSPFAINVAGSD